MTAETDSLDLLERSLAQVATLLDGAAATARTTPTPCRSWNLDALIGHLLADLVQFRKAAAGGRVSFDDQAPAVGDDPAAAFRTGAADLLATWRAADLTATAKLPIGEFPVTFALDQQITEFAVHAWDLAVTTGQKPHYDEGVALAALGFGQKNLRSEYRGSEDDGKSFGPEVEVAEDAPVQDRLVGYFGRPSAD